MMLSYWLLCAVSAQFAVEGMHFGDPFAQLKGYFAPPAAPYVAPGRLFSIKLPGDFDPVTVKSNKDTVEFVSKHGEAALLITRVTVPSGANARQMLLNSIEQKLSKLPGFQQVQRRDVMIAGAKAAALDGTYNYQGNIQYPRTVEEIFAVFGTDAFYFHFECGPNPGQYVDALTTIYTSFVPRPPEEAGPAQPEVEPLPDVGY
jgi:hypothetical protein